MVVMKSRPLEVRRKSTVSTLSVVTQRPGRVMSEYGKCSLVLRERFSVLWLNISLISTMWMTTFALDTG